jgi:hypothetical protein
MNVAFLRLVCAACLLFALHAAVFAETVAIVASADTTLSQRQPDSNLGGHAQFLAGADGTGGLLRRGLVWFDVAGYIPAGATIDTATLTLTANANNTNVGDFHLHRMLVDWTEGVGLTSQGSPALPGESTWNNRHHPGTPWAAPGGMAGSDYASAASTTTTVNLPGPYDWIGLAADVQSMLDSPAANYGWMLRSDREGEINTARQFESSESPTGAFPTLEVTYTQIPEPSSALLMTVGIAFAAAATRRFRYCITAK